MPNINLILLAGRLWLVLSVMGMTAPTSSSPESTRVSPPSCPGYRTLPMDRTTATVMVLSHHHHQVTIWPRYAPNTQYHYLSFWSEENYTTPGNYTILVTTWRPMVTTSRPMVTTWRPMVWSTTSRPIVTTGYPMVTTWRPMVTTWRPTVTTEHGRRLQVQEVLRRNRFQKL